MRLHPVTFKLRAVAIAAALFCAPSVLAQSGFELGRSLDDPARPPVLTLDTERLISTSDAGRAIDRALSDKSAALAAENRRIEAELTEEEKDLSVRRASLTAEAFRAEAAAFDEKVNTIRAEQDAKLRELQVQTDNARLAILRAANPVLVSILQDSSAVAILEKSSVIVALAAIDITDEAIERLDGAIDSADIDQILEGTAAEASQDSGATPDATTPGATGD